MVYEQKNYASVKVLTEQMWKVKKKLYNFMFHKNLAFDEKHTIKSNTNVHASNSGLFSSIVYVFYKSNYPRNTLSFFKIFWGLKISDELSHLITDF